MCLKCYCRSCFRDGRVEEENRYRKFAISGALLSDAKRMLLLRLYNDNDNSDDNDDDDIL